MTAYWRLIRPGLLAAVLFSMAVAALTAADPPTWTRLGRAMLGVALVIAGASAMNQFVERRCDAKMARTASRPLPSNRLSVRHAAAFAAICSFAGVGYLAAVEPPVAAILAASSWLLYVLIYTPLKRTSVWHAPVGAVAGAMPVLLGAETAGAVFTPNSLALFGVVFFWQLPHTAAIGWIYREQYALGGAKVAAVADPSGKTAGRLALFGAAGLLLTSLVPAAQSTVAWPYAAVALFLGMGHAALAARFLASPSDADARALWRMSLAHLPALWTALLLASR